jgi:hypothetical protein
MKMTRPAFRRHPTFRVTILVAIEVRLDQRKWLKLLLNLIFGASRARDFKARFTPDHPARLKPTLTFYDRRWDS